MCRSKPFKASPKALTRFLPILACVFFACCSTGQKTPTLSPPPYVMEGREGIFLNTFSLAQGDFPLLGEVEKLPGAPEFTLLPEKEALALLNERFKAHGHSLKKNYHFHYGRIDVKLDGYDKRRYIGYIYISKDDFEKPKDPPDGKESSRGYFYTEKSPDGISVPELIMLEQLNGGERTYIALINAHQFSWPAGDDAEEMREKMLKKLEARIELYLMWVDARHEKRKKQAEK